MNLFCCPRDRIRTSVNVLGDAFGVGIVAHLSQKELSRTDHVKVREIEIGEIVAILSHSDLSKLREYPVFDKSIEMKKRSKDANKLLVVDSIQQLSGRGHGTSCSEILSHSDLTKLRDYPVSDKSIEMEKRSEDAKKVVDSIQDLSGRGHGTSSPEIGQE